MASLFLASRNSKRVRRSLLLSGLFSGALAGASIIGCGGPQEPGGEGAECYRDADCQLGLVCVPSGEARVCSSDVSGIISMVEGPPPPADAGTGDPDAG